MHVSSTDQPLFGWKKVCSSFWMGSKEYDRQCSFDRIYGFDPCLSKQGLLLGSWVLEYRLPQVLILPESLKSLLTADWGHILLHGYNECNGGAPFSGSWRHMYARCVGLIMESLIIGGKAVHIQIHPAPRGIVFPSKHLITKKDSELSPNLYLQVIIIKINIRWSQIVTSLKSERTGAWSKPRWPYIITNHASVVM